MNNFIKLTEIQFTGTNPKEYTDYIRPKNIEFMELISKNGSTYTKIHFIIGPQKCDMLVKETPKEIDTLIDEFYKGQKNPKVSPSSKRGNK